MRGPVRRGRVPTRDGPRCRGWPRAVWPLACEGWSGVLLVARTLLGKALRLAPWSGFLPWASSDVVARLVEESAADEASFETAVGLESAVYARVDVPESQRASELVAESVVVEPLEIGSRAVESVLHGCRC